MVRKLREADRLLKEGFELPDVLKELDDVGIARLADPACPAGCVAVTMRPVMRLGLAIGDTRNRLSRNGGLSSYSGAVG
jgi:hypothetical protein